MTHGSNPFGSNPSGAAGQSGATGGDWSPFGPPTGGQRSGTGGAVPPSAGMPSYRHTAGTASSSSSLGSLLDSDDEPAALSPIRAGSPPLLWLAAAFISATLGLIIVLVLHDPGTGNVPYFAFISWVLAGPAAIGLLAIFLTKDTNARARALYAAPAWVPWAYRAVLLVALVAIVLSAIRIADWAGRL